MRYETYNSSTHNIGVQKLTMKMLVGISQVNKKSEMKCATKDLQLGNVTTNSGAVFSYGDGSLTICNQRNEGRI